MSAPPEQQKTSSAALVQGFFKDINRFQIIPEDAKRKNFYSDFIRSLLKVDHIEIGRVICTFTVKASVTNPYNILHGGLVASVAEAVGMACAKSVAGDKEFFLGEFSIAYLAAARLDTEVEVEGCILRNGRSVVVTNIDFRMKESKKLAYTTRATYYTMPVANL